MNYQKIYNSLVEYRQQNPANGYVEKHHILPKSMGGSDEAANLVVLTGREHWVAHLLLWKIHRNSQTVHACHMMAMRCKARGISKVRSSRMYETLRIEHSKLASERNKITHIGEGNSQYGTHWICNLELQQNKKISKDEEIPEGWVIGRNRWKLIKPKRIKLRKRIAITNGIINTYLIFEDQLPIPRDWWFGLTLSDQLRDVKSKRALALNKRKIGTKYNKIKKLHSST